jgi:hypothetical protein
VHENANDNSEDLSTDAKTVLNWILRKYCGKVLIGFIWHRLGAVVGDRTQKDKMILNIY